MNLLGIAILIKTEDDYKGIVSNVSKGQVFVGFDTLASREHYHLQKIIYKIHGKFPDEMPNATFGYLAIDENGTVTFVDRKEASKADNLKNRKDTIYSYDVKWFDKPSLLYEQELENMRVLIKEHHLTDDDLYD